ncbi:MAG: cysteine peptidase family C39 domain-containing protein [Patescibacteria group bacterium]
MQPLNPFRQSPGLCGPASLKILLDHYGREFSEEELSELCDATVEKGTDHVGLIKAANEIGEDPIAKDNATIEELRELVEKEIPVIVGWYSEHGEPDDHYSVVYEVTDDMISMMDPERDEGTLTMPISEFEKVWYDFEGSERMRVERWMMAIPGLTKSGLTTN